MGAEPCPIVHGIVQRQDGWSVHRRTTGSTKRGVVVDGESTERLESLDILDEALGNNSSMVRCLVDGAWYGQILPCPDAAVQCRKAPHVRVVCQVTTRP